MAAHAGKKRVVLVGLTGAGKSSLGNLLIGSDGFATSSLAASETSDAKFVQHDDVDVLDTIGLNDTSKSQVVVRSKILDGLRMMAHGVDVFLIVFPLGRLTEDARDAYHYLFKGILGEAAYRNAVLVLTKCNSDLQTSQAKQAEWLADSKAKAPAFKDMFDAVGGRVLFVNNPPPLADARREADNIEDRAISRRDVMQLVNQFHQPPYTFAEAKAAADEYDAKMAEIKKREEDAKRQLEELTLAKGAEAARAAMQPELERLQRERKKADEDRNNTLERLLDRLEQQAKQQQQQPVPGHHIPIPQISITLPCPIQ